MKADHFSPDTLTFIELLHLHGVQYLIVGGEAVIYYGYPRLTGDVDFFYGNEPRNVSRLFEALSEFWEGDIPGISKEEELLEEGMVIQFGVPPNRIDLMNKIDGVDFSEAWEEKKTEQISSIRKNLPVYFLGLKHLIINKRESGRNKDLDDLAYLSAIRDENDSDS